MAPSTALKIARAAVARGWRPFPVPHRSKAPTQPWGVKAASAPTDRMLEMWFPEGVELNVGIATKPSGLFVLDEDTPGELDRLCAARGTILPPTYTVHTAKGRQLYYAVTYGPENVHVLANRQDVDGLDVDVRGAGNGFNQLFPLGHKYFGFMDLYGRSNIETPNVLVQASPHDKVRLQLWYHYFFLENANDTPYNVNMTAFSPGSAPASRDLGHEIDLTTQYLITPRMDILFGYSHFFAGQYYKLTPGLPYRGDADFFYTQYSLNF